MSLWKFNNSSQALFNQCLEASHPQDLWLTMFKCPAFMERISTGTVRNQQSIISGTAHIPIEVDKLCKVLEQEPVEKFQDMLKQCKNNFDLFYTLSRKLSTQCVEKICEHVFSNEDIDFEFLHHFYSSFLPDFLNRNLTMYAVDIMIRSKVHALAFKALLNQLITNIQISNMLLKLYAETLDYDDKYNLLRMFRYESSSSAVFKHHIFTIYILYKDLHPTIPIQDMIFTMLREHGHLFTTDQDYGKLLLMYLKKHREVGLPMNFDLVSKCLDLHMSVYKRPCNKILHDIIKQHQLEEDERLRNLNYIPPTTSDYGSD